MPYLTPGTVENRELHALAERMGEDEFAARLQAEQQMRESRGEGQSRGWFRFEHVWDLYGMIRGCLKLSGFWGRAHRNYFDIQVVRNEVVLERLPAAFDGFTILQLTDLHIDMHPDFPEAVRRVIAPLDYDVMALTGDFRTCTFSDHSGATAATIEMLNEVEAPRYAILGNHDSLAKVPTMEAAGIQFLLNEHVVLRRGDDALHLVGIDDPNFYKSHNFEHALRGVPADACKVLLSHSPETYRDADQLGFDFLMAGHTHGGQICLPGGRVLVHDHSSPRHLLSGAWREGQLQGYTSRGTGASGLPVRLNCMPEVTLHVLRCGGRG
jgi:predicted MPP superfamily phosphohydrolase